MTTSPHTGRDASGVAAAAEALRDTVTARGWLAPGLRADAGTAALDATMRPVDAVTAAGLDWLLPLVQPLQDVLDRLAGNTSAIWSFADAWQRASTTVEQVGQRFSRSASTTGEQWHGTAADRYLGRAAEITESLHGSATTFRALGSIATTMGEAAAGARSQANDLVTDLVARLIPYVGQATAVEGGVTPNVMTQATSMINSYAAPIADIERKLSDTITNLQPLFTDGGTASAMSGQTAQDIAPDPEAPRSTQQGRHQAPAAPHQPERPPANDNEPNRRSSSLPRIIPGPGGIVGLVARRLGIIGVLIWLDEMLAEEFLLLLPPDAPPGEGEPPAQQPPVPPAATPPSDPVRQPPGLPEATPPVLPEATPPGTPPARSPDEAPPTRPPGDPARQQPGDIPLVAPPGDHPGPQQPGDVPPAAPPDTPPAQDQSPQQQQPTMNAEGDPPSENEPPAQEPPASDTPPQAAPAPTDSPSAEPPPADKIWPDELSYEDKWAQADADPPPQPLTSTGAFEVLQERRLWAEITEDNPGRQWSAQLAGEMPSDNDHETKRKLVVTGHRHGEPSIVVEVSVIYDRTTGQFEDMHLSSGRSRRQ